MSKAFFNSRILDRFRENKPVKTCVQTREFHIFPRTDATFGALSPAGTFLGLPLNEDGVTSSFMVNDLTTKRGTYFSFTIEMRTIHFAIWSSRFFIALVKILTLASWFFSSLVFHMNVWYWVFGRGKLKILKLLALKWEDGLHWCRNSRFLQNQKLIKFQRQLRFIVVKKLRLLY